MKRIQTLGGLAVYDEGRLLGGNAQQPRRLAVLAILARAGDRGINRDRLAGLLWGDIEEERARRNLNQALYALRQELGAEDAILGTRDLRLNPAVVETDVVDFDEARAAGSLEAAARCYTGPFLGDFHLPGVPDFSRWAEEERSALAADYRAVVESLAVGATGRGNFADAVPWWRRLAAIDPGDGPAAQGLMRALAQAGDSPGALRHAEIFETLRREDLELPPDPDVAALAERIRLGQLLPAARPASETAPAGTAPSAAVDRPPAPAPQEQVAHAAPRKWIVPVVIVALALTFAVRSRRPVDVAAAARFRIAVLPFEDRTQARQLGGLAQYLTARVGDTLASLASLQVLAVPGGTGIAAGRIDSVAQRLGAFAVVTGTVDTLADTVRLVARLVDGRTGRQLASASASQPAGDGARRGELVSGVVGALRERIGRAIRVEKRRQGVSPEVWELIERAGELSDAGGDAASTAGIAPALQLFAGADSLLARASRLAPKSSTPLVERAKLADLRGWVAEASRSASGVNQASADSLGALAASARIDGLRFADAAIAADPDDAEARYQRASLEAGLWRSSRNAGDSLLDRAIIDFQNALRVDPTQSTAWHELGRTYLEAGRFKEASFAGLRAMDAATLVTDMSDATSLLMVAALNDEQWRDAERWCASGRAAWPEDPRFDECNLVLLAWSATHPKAVDTAWALVRQLDRGRSVRVIGNVRGLHRMLVAIVLARVGMGDSAEAVVRSVRREAEQRGFDQLQVDYRHAYIEVLRGDTAAALRLLSRYVDRRPPSRPLVARTPWFAGLRGDSSFRSLTSRR